MARRKTVKNKATALKTEQGKRDTCFTIMPFGGWFDDYYSAIFRPAIESVGLIPCRADDLYRPSTIVHDIWTYTKDAKIILADLTGKNPNVFYELGLAHALAKPVILVAESIADIPFDLRALRVIEYNKNSPAWGSLLRQKIESAIKEIVETPLESVLPAFLNVKASTATPSVTPHQKDILELKQDIELLRKEIRITRDPNVRRPREIIDVEEAMRLLKLYIESDLATETIIKNLTDRGVPATWVRKQIEEFSSTNDLTQKESTPGEAES